MKKYYLALLFVFTVSIGFAQEALSFDITSPFKLWLLNQEARAMQEICRDDILINRSIAPFAILPTMNFSPNKAEEKLWQIHRKIYAFLDEVQSIYDLSKHFGSGNFSVSLKQARPEIWGYSAIPMTGFSLPKSLTNEVRKGFLDALFVVIGLETSRDRDLSARLKVAIKSLKDEEYRLTNNYIASFKALFPNERSIVNLELFLREGVAKQFGTGLNSVIKSIDDLRPGAASTMLSSDDPLAELEELTKSAVEEESKPIATMEAPDPDAAEIYDLGL